MVESFLAESFVSGVKFVKIWSSEMLNRKRNWYGSEEVLEFAKNVIQYQSAQGGWPKVPT